MSLPYTLDLMLDSMATGPFKIFSSPVRLDIHEPDARYVEVRLNEATYNIGVGFSVIVPWPGFHEGFDLRIREVPKGAGLRVTMRSHSGGGVILVCEEAE